ncbi:unnamed protein product [Caenorhabditis angaria]|uniref:M-phase phosphoprotein 6 n=1 Tax=Caenorhabditis angaria TaxID=860376 RepID=A0A9P1ICY2_9PELO|nr:unnamed protein product [Caenorhabditis angaria]
MSNDRITVKQLSSGVMDMKFMLRKKKQLEAKEKKKKDVEIQRKFEEPVQQSSSNSTERNYEICTDLTKLEDLSFGRMSFKGYNKEVEELMVYYERLKNGELFDDEDNGGKDVDDKEMAQTLGLKKKFMSKRERNQADMKSNVETSSKNGKFNFSDVRKRHAQPEDEPERKFMKPSD